MASLFTSVRNVYKCKGHDTGTAKGNIMADSTGRREMTPFLQSPTLGVRVWGLMQKREQATKQCLGHGGKSFKSSQPPTRGMFLFICPSRHKYYKNCTWNIYSIHNIHYFNSYTIYCCDYQNLLV